MSTNKETAPVVKKTILDSFVEGGKNGFGIASNVMLPNVLLAFALIQVLNITGLLDILGNIFQPIMGIFGLPGVAVTVLFGAWLSAGGGFGVAASLLTAGQLAGNDAAILLPAIILMGSQLQYMGRILGTADVKTKYYVPLLVISVINACIAMFIMNLFV